MGCEPLVQGNQVVGHICYGPKTKEVQLRKRHRMKFCFKCRKHLPHMLTASVPIEPSYYEPNVWWKCQGCGHDYTTFPGY
jgi:RNase P subunit RPR2